MSPQPWPGRRRAESLWATLGQDFETPIPDPDSPPKQARLQGPRPRPRRVREGTGQTRDTLPDGRAGGSDLLARQVVKVPGPSPRTLSPTAPAWRPPGPPLPRPTSQALTMSLSVPDMSAAELAQCVSSGRPGSLPARSPRSRLRPPRSPPAAPPRFAQVLGSSPGLTAAGPGVPGGGRNRRSEIQESGLLIAPGWGPPCPPEGPPAPRD